MPRIKKFTEASISKCRIPSGRQQCDWFENLSLRGKSLILSISYRGTRSWSVLYYDEGKPRRKKLGEYPKMGAEAARTLAINFDVDDVLSRVKAGTFEDIAERWFKDHVQGRKIKSAPEMRRHLTKYVYPRWKSKPFTDIRRAEVNQLLSKIAQDHGAPQADAILSTVKSIMSWYTRQSETYASPIVAGMHRDHRSPEQKSRSRILDQDEIRSLWKACDELGGAFAGIIKLALLTGSRRTKIAEMQWTDVDLDTGVWTIPIEDSSKGTVTSVRLTEMALDVIRQQPRLAGNPYIFGSQTNRHGVFNLWSQRKSELNAKLPSNMPPWVIHNLRRTTSSLMAEIGVLDHVAERVLGHRQQGVQSIYNRHSYFEEKSDALSRVAARIQAILNPERKVVQFRA